MSSSTSLRVWLAGGRAFGTAVFDALSGLPGVRIVAVTTPGDDPLARAAQSAGLPTGPEIAPGGVADAGTDVIVSAHNYAHISADARAAAVHGAIGYHPSLLPRHRGRRSIEHTISAGDPIAGGTVYQIDDGWDTGPIIAQAFCHVVPGWSASDLWRERLFAIGVELLTQVVATGPPWETVVQDERVATQAN